MPQLYSSTQGSLCGATFRPASSKLVHDLRGDGDGVTLVPYAEPFRPLVVALLYELPNLYPLGGEWLERRLTDVSNGRARAQLAFVGHRLCGVTIEVPKVGRGWKLSTIYVVPEQRGRGIGTLLMNSCVAFWRKERIGQNIVTVRKARELEIARLLAPFGFDILDEQVDRYGPGRTEVILQRLGNLP